MGFLSGLFPAGMRRRWWAFRPLDLLARYWPVVGRKRRGALVVRMDGIGDMVLFRRSLDHYAEALGLPIADITVLGCKSWSSIGERVFAGYQLHCIDEHAFHRKGWYRFRKMRWVRRQNFDVALCDQFFRKALMADSLVWASGAPKRMACMPHVSDRTAPEFAWYLEQVDRVVDTGPYPTHEITRHYRFVSAMMGREVAPEAPVIQWRDAVPPVPKGAPYVVLNIGSNEPGRRWPLDGFLEIARRLLDWNFRVVFVGGRPEMGFAQTINGQLSQPGVVNLIGRTNLPQLLDVIRHAAGLLSSDTGPAHLGIALGTPTVVVVGGGHFGAFVPYPPEATPRNTRFVSRDMDCYHCFWSCFKRQDRQASFPCVAAVHEDTVWEELQNLLTGKVMVLR